MGHIPVAKPSPIPRGSFPRRGLAVALIVLGFFALFGVALSSAWIRHGPPVGTNGPSWIKALQERNLAVDEPVHVTEYRLWLVKTRDGEIIALSHKEPARGCTIPWRPQLEWGGHEGWFRDPCSGSTFDMRGVKQFGPSPRNMDRFETNVVAGWIEVHVGKGVPIVDYPAYDETYFVDS